MPYHMMAWQHARHCQHNIMAILITNIKGPGACRNGLEQPSSGPGPGPGPGPERAMAPSGGRAGTHELARGLLVPATAHNCANNCANAKTAAAGMPAQWPTRHASHRHHAHKIYANGSKIDANGSHRACKIHAHGSPPSLLMPTNPHWQTPN